MKMALIYKKARIMNYYSYIYNYNYNRVIIVLQFPFHT